jgi:hypothetical protein
MAAVATYLNDGSLLDSKALLQTIIRCPTSLPRITTRQHAGEWRRDRRLMGSQIRHTMRDRDWLGVGDADS